MKQLVFKERFIQHRMEEWNEKIEMSPLEPKGIADANDNENNILLDLEPNPCLGRLSSKE